MAQPPRRGDPDPLELIDSGQDRRRSALPDLHGDDSGHLAHLATLGHLVDVYLHRLLKPHGLSLSDYRVMSTLRLRPRAERATPQDLNRFTRITSAGMTRTLDRLEDAGYLERAPNPDDRRSVLVGLTDAGWEFAESVVRDLHAQYGELAAGLSAPERKSEVESLRGIITRLSAAITRTR